MLDSTHAVFTRRLDNDQKMVIDNSPNSNNVLLCKAVFSCIVLEIGKLKGILLILASC